MSKQNKKYSAFTIVELLIVIVIIGILAAITIVSYTNITKKANESSIQADLANAKKQIELYKVIHGQYPTGLDQSTGCLTGNIAPSPDTNYCLKKSNSTATYTMSNADGTIYTLKLDNGTLAYKITESTGPTSTTTTPIAESFVKTWGGSGNEYVQNVIQTNDSGYAATGYTTSFGAGSVDMLLMKFDNLGNIVWSKTWGGSGNDYGQGLARTSDGGYAVAGYTNSYGAGTYDAFLAKYDTLGSLVWNKTWGGASTEYSYSVVQAIDGGYVITGEATSYGAGNSDMFVAKYDTTGSLSWNKTWGGAGSECGYDIVQTNDGGYAISGSTSYGAGTGDAFLTKYDATGNLSWNKTWGGVNSDYGQSLIQTNDGGVMITGYTSSYGSGTSGDMFVAKYDLMGNLSWNKTWGGVSSEIGLNLVQATDGGYVVTGYTNSYGAGGYDMFLIKYDSLGNLTWNKTWGGAVSDITYGLAITSDGGFAVSGYTSNYGSGGDNVLIAKFNSLGGITNCTSPMCQTPTATITTPSATVTSPSATITTPSTTVTTPSATITTPTATQTTVVAAP